MPDDSRIEVSITARDNFSAVIQAAATNASQSFDQLKTSAASMAEALRQSGGDLGKVTPEKRVSQAIRGLAAIAEAVPRACLLLAGEAGSHEQERDAELVRRARFAVAMGQPHPHRGERRFRRCRQGP